MIVGAHKHPDQSKSIFLEGLSENFSIYLGTYENVTLLGDFNMTPEDKNLQIFADSIKKPTCFKGSPSCIDLITTNRKSHFKNTWRLKTGISDFRKLATVSSKSKILKAPPKRTFYRDYNIFHQNSLINAIKSNLDSIKDLYSSSFEDILINLLNARSSRPEMFCKKGVLRNFAKFTGFYKFTLTCA